MATSKKPSAEQNLVNAAKGRAIVVGYLNSADFPESKAQLKESCIELFKKEKLKIENIDWVLTTLVKQGQIQKIGHKYAKVDYSEPVPAKEPKVPKADSGIKIIETKGGVRIIVRKLTIDIEGFGA